MCRGRPPGHPPARRPRPLPTGSGGPHGQVPVSSCSSLISKSSTRPGSPLALPSGGLAVGCSARMITSATARARPLAESTSSSSSSTPMLRAATPSSSGTAGFALALEPAPAARSVVGDDLLEHGGERGRVDGFALAEGHRAGGLVVVAGRDDPVGIGDEAAVVEEHVDMVLGGEQRADVALQHEIRLAGALDGLCYLGVGAVDQ